MSLWIRCKLEDMLYCGWFLRKDVLHGWIVQGWLIAQRERGRGGGGRGRERERSLYLLNCYRRTLRHLLCQLDLSLLWTRAGLLSKHRELKCINLYKKSIIGLRWRGVAWKQTCDLKQNHSNALWALFVEKTASANLPELLLLRFHKLGK